MQQLYNRYYALRHGESLANTAGIIVSDLSQGVNSYGLSDKGKMQVSRVMEQGARLGDDIKIYSSDFLRAAQTAELARESLGVETPIVYTELLRERNFGELNGNSDADYHKVWELDVSDADHRTFGVESVRQVYERASGLIKLIEASCSGGAILLVSHGDILQIMQTWFADIDPADHRSLPHLNTAEVRLLNSDPV